ncbi:M20 family metallopeptidase [Naumannella halotolerans]|uniref:M20 family metallopeptidase n=1 Tax=Naumannella halotolerans TaxID=993414 RepID=UPI00370DD7B9
MSTADAPLIRLTSALIRAAGENPGGTEAATVDVLAGAAASLGLQTRIDEVAPGRQNISITLPGGDGPGLLFLGHSDVVPAGPGWSRAPFSGAVVGDRVHGRGSSDMKGGLAAVLTAMGRLQRAGAQLSGPLTLACTVDEEDTGLGIRALVEAGLDHDYLGCVVAEPTDLQTVIACRGDSYLEVTVTGVPAHSGRPADGRNAIDAAARVLMLLADDQHRLDDHADPLLGSGSWSTGRISGGHGTSMVAPNCSISLDRRLLPDEDPAAIAQTLLERIRQAGITGDGIEVAIDVSMEMPGFRTDAEHRLVRAAGGTPTGWTAACDGGFVSRDLGIDCIILGPGGLNDQAHQVDESVGIDELVTATRRYEQLALDLLGDEQAG